MRNKFRAKVKGRTSAWAAIKKFAKPPAIHGEWQAMLDEEWSEYMREIKQQKAETDDASVMRLDDGELHTAEEVEGYIHSAEAARRAARRREAEAPSAARVQRMVQSITANKIQQFKQDSDGTASRILLATSSNAT